MFFYNGNIKERQKNLVLLLVEKAKKIAADNAAAKIHYGFLIIGENQPNIRC